MTSLLESAVSQEAAQSRLCAYSIVLAIGRDVASVAEAVAPWLEVADAEEDGELVVVDDSADDAVRHALGGLVGNVRVLHHVGVLGSARAIARGAALATHEIVLVCFPGTSATTEFVTAARAWFASDPGAAIALGPSGAFLVRRACLEQAGGEEVLETLGSGAEVAALAGRLARGGWRARLDAGGATVWFGGWKADPDRNPIADRLDWRPPFNPPALVSGINVVGLLEAACGIGDAARRTIEAIAASSVPYSTHAYHFHASPAFPYAHHGGERLAYDTNLLALNPDLLPAFGGAAGSELWSRRYTIGLWFWELETLTPTIRHGFRYVNELWASTRFLADAFAAAFERHVEVIPLPVRRRDGSPSLRRSNFGLDDRFSFLSTFDFGSVALRKNGLGVLEAFTRAFEPGEGPVLLLKTLNAAWDPLGWAELERAVNGRRDVRILDGYLDDESMSSLIGLADCYVSLHRAEGFGLTPAEAMAWGRPVIATGYSGNLEFMSEANSFLVPYELVPVDRRLHRVYPATARWAEPRLDAAAEAMRRVVADPAAAAARAALGQRDIRRSNSVEAAAKAIAERLGVIEEARRLSALGPARPRPAKGGRR